MIKLNWIIILAIIILLVFLYVNNSEHFGATDTINPEAVRNISSVYNTDNLTATNITASNNLTSTNNLTSNNLKANNLTATNITASNTLTIPGNNKITLSAADGNKLLIDATTGKNPFFINNGIDMGCYDSWRIFNNGDARFNGNLLVGNKLKIGSWYLEERNGLLFIGKDGANYPSLRLRSGKDLDKNGVEGWGDAIKIYNNNEYPSYWWYNGKGQFGDFNCVNKNGHCINQ